MNLDKEKIIEQQIILEEKQIKLMRQLKTISSSDYEPNKHTLKINEDRKAWVEILEKNNYNLAITLNFNPKNPNNAYETKIFETFNIEKANNKIKEWWMIYNRYHFGQKCFKTKNNNMKFIGIFENAESNIHCHIAMKWKHETITDFDIYKEEHLMANFWKTVVNSGTVYIDNINSKDWFYYMTKNDNFQNKMVINGDIPNILDKYLYH